MIAHDDLTEITETEEAELVAQTAAIAAQCAPLLAKRAGLLRRLDVIAGPPAARQELQRRLEIVEARLSVIGVET